MIATNTLAYMRRPYRGRTHWVFGCNAIPRLVDEGNLHHSSVPNDRFTAAAHKDDNERAINISPHIIQRGANSSTSRPGEADVRCSARTRKVIYGSRVIYSEE